MMGICSEMGEKLEKIFMDEFSIFGSTFSESLHYLDFILKRVKETSKTVTQRKIPPRNTKTASP
jgi:hypothetical protein